MINLQELTKQKFERMGFEQVTVNEDANWYKNYMGTDQSKVMLKEAQLITLDSEIEKLEFTIEQLKETYLEFRSSKAAPQMFSTTPWEYSDDSLDTEISDLLLNRIKFLEQQLAELKKMREGL